MLPRWRARSVPPSLPPSLCLCLSLSPYHHPRPAVRAPTPLVESSIIPFSMCVCVCVCVRACVNVCLCACVCMYVALTPVIAYTFVVASSLHYTSSSRSSLSAGCLHRTDATQSGQNSDTNSRRYGACTRHHVLPVSNSLPASVSQSQNQPLYPTLHSFERSTAAVRVSGGGD